MTCAHCYTGSPGSDGGPDTDPRNCDCHRTIREDLTAARQRIAALEDWQRRAVGTGLLDEHNGCQCRTCRDVTQLLSEVKS